jgi:SP family general alpha glucoside:H+ symporter-like MFS transporter
MNESMDDKAPTGDAAVTAHNDNYEDHALDLDEKAGITQYKGDAIVAENEEHDMGVLQAVAAYPAATFWAFIMSFTIVSVKLNSLL